MYGASYIDGRPDPGTRIDPNNPVVKSGNQFWPLVKQPFRSQPRALALSQDGRKLYAGTALYAEDGELLALAGQTWIGPRPSAG